MHQSSEEGVQFTESSKLGFPLLSPVNTQSSQMTLAFPTLHTIHPLCDCRFSLRLSYRGGDKQHLAMAGMPQSRSLVVNEESAL